MDNLQRAVTPSQSVAGSGSQNFKIVHDGRGNARRIETPGFGDATVDVPRQPQKLKDVAKFLARRETFTKRADAIKNAHTNYKPGFLLELGNDQCRFPISDENNLMCGGKTDGSSYCAHHHNISRRQK